MVRHPASAHVFPRVFLPCLIGLLCLSCGAGSDDPSSPRPDPAAGGAPRASPAVPSNPLSNSPPAVNPLTAAEGTGPSDAVFRLAPLSPDMLDRVVELVGRRVGVRVAAIVPGGPAREWGVAVGDILVAAGPEAITSAEDIDRMLAAPGGLPSLTVLRKASGGEWRILPLSTGRRSAVAAGAPGIPPPAPTEPGVVAPTGPSPLDRSLGGSVAAYFDMLDFCRTEGWGRRSATPAAARTRAVRLLEQSLPEVDAETRAAVGRLPEVWAVLKRKWAKATEAVRDRQREVWRDRLLLPNPFLPPPPALSHFRSEAGHHEFDYPVGWVLAQNRIDDTGLLFLGPPGTETTWDQVSNPAKSPSGVLFVISPLTEELRAARVIEGARLLVRQYITPFAPEMREVAAFPVGPGGMIVLRGHYPGQSEESFLWLGTMPFGPGTFLAGRFGGRVSEAEALLPVFTTMLITLEVTVPDELADAQIGLAFSVIGNAIVNTGWSD